MIELRAGDADDEQNRSMAVVRDIFEDLYSDIEAGSIDEESVYLLCSRYNNNHHTLNRDT